MTLKINYKSDFIEALQDLPALDKKAVEQAVKRQSELTKPLGSLGRLEDIAVFFAGWQVTQVPTSDYPVCIVFAGNHGVAARGVSAFPAEVTAQMVQNFKDGGAAINQLSNAAGAALKVISLNLDQPTHDFTSQPAMSEVECCAAIQAGIDAIPSICDVLLLGEMGIGNTTSAATVALSTFGGRALDWVGPGSGIDDRAIQIKQQIIQHGYDLHHTKQNNAFDILQTVGGRELAAIAGAVLMARHRRIPVLLDGFITTAAAAALTKSNPRALDHGLVSHVSAEPGHKQMLSHLGQQPLLNLNMRLGEASGAAVALLIVKAALAAHNGMATFSEAGVSTKG